MNSVMLRLASKPVIRNLGTSPVKPWACGQSRLPGLNTASPCLPLISDRPLPGLPSLRRGNPYKPCLASLALDGALYGHARLASAHAAGSRVVQVAVPGCACINAFVVARSALLRTRLKLFTLPAINRLRKVRIMAYAERNRKIKQVLSAAFGAGKVTGQSRARNGKPLGSNQYRLCTEGC